MRRSLSALQSRRANLVKLLNVAKARNTYLVQVTRLHGLADGLSLADLIDNTGTFLAVLDVIVDLPEDALKHLPSLPDIGVWFWVFKRLQVDSNALCLGDNLDVFVILWQLV